jgi:amidohydrolase
MKRANAFSVSPIDCIHYSWNLKLATTVSCGPAESQLSRCEEHPLVKALDQDIVRFRRHLHANPELSELESETARLIVARLRRCNPAAVVGGLGHMGTGVCAVYDSGTPGPTLLLRCELDALPIAEVNRFAHRSTRPGVSHKCGHDGHMATLVAVADSLNAEPIERGRVYLVFQPAEETGTGAQAVIDDVRFKALTAPDFVYAFHNVPKYPLGQVLVRNGVIAQGSVGFIAEFTGITSHSSYPEHGLSPATALTEVVGRVNGFGESLAAEVSAPVLGTVSYAELGNANNGRNFGISPGAAVVMGVLRAQESEDLLCIREELTRLVATVAAQHRLENTVSWHEAFAPTVSTSTCSAIVADAACKAGLDVVELDEPFRWSEDFGYFTEAYPGAFFGLGSGIEQPQLHDNRYDYPDDLIAIGARLYRAIIDRHLRG